MFKKILTIGLSVGVATSLMAEPNVQMGAMKAKLKKMAGKPGIFLQGKENFPKDYFLVSKNLPFLAGLTLGHPKSSSLGLSKEQIAKIQKIASVTVPKVVKASKDIKMLELTLADNIAIKSNTAKSQYEIVDAISKLRTDLTKAHLKCINEVRAVLTKEQYKKLLKYATVNMMPQEKSKPNELISFMHGGKMVMMFGEKLGINDKQMMRFANEIQMEFVPKIQKSMKRVASLEKLVKEAVYTKHKNSKELKKYVDEIANLKKDVANYRIEAYLVLQNILTKEQFKKGMKILQGME
jgi:Spy/CpxP family protein refolding chaperone